MRRQFDFLLGDYYHIFNSGVEKRPLFNDAGDRDRMMQLLYLANSKNPIQYKRIKGSPFTLERGKPVTSMLAYCLMPDHVQLIVRESAKGGLSKFLSKLFTSYAMYYNAKYRRSGSLFCHPFRAQRIVGHKQFKSAFSSVHLSPLAAFETHPNGSDVTPVDLLKLFWHSSYMDYFGTSRSEGKILSKRDLPVRIDSLEQVERMHAARFAPSPRVRASSLDVFWE